VRGDGTRERRSEGSGRADRAVDLGIVATQKLLYLVAGTLLVAAAVFTVVATIQDVIAGAQTRHVSDTAVFVLERTLLLFIIAELLHTLGLVNFDGRILVEPFLFIALIAVVRRVLVITAEIEGQPHGDALHDYLLQLGALGGLTLVLSLSIFLLRRRAPDSGP
jgi:uncharacterized membrane protein (DUF373 family)